MLFVCMNGGWKVVQWARKGWQVPLILKNTGTPCSGHQMKSTQVVHRGAGSSRFSAQVAKCNCDSKRKEVVVVNEALKLSIYYLVESQIPPMSTQRSYYAIHLPT